VKGQRARTVLYSGKRWLVHWQGAVVLRMRLLWCGAQTSVSLGLDVAHKGDENTQPTTLCSLSRITVSATRTKLTGAFRSFEQLTGYFCMQHYAGQHVLLSKRLQFRTAMQRSPYDGHPH
jgi:hypothetical protein